MQEVKEEEIQKSEKTSIMQFLMDNSAYDCMPRNSLICAVEKDIKIVNAIELLLEEKAEELLIWDSKLVEWNFLFSLADVIRFTLFSVQSYALNLLPNLENRSFRRLSEDRMERMIDQTEPQESLQSCSILKEISKIDRQQFVESISHLSVVEFMSEVYDLSTFKLTRVGLEVKLTAIILTMLTRRIHRVVVEDKSSQMVTSILSYKDFLLFLTRSVNEQFTNTLEYVMQIGVLLQKVKSRESSMLVSRSVWTAFDTMVNINKTQWLHILDDNGRYLDTLFREDFHFIIEEWKIEMLSLSIGEFLQIKKQSYRVSNNKLPDLMLFKPQDTFKEVVQKIILSQRNTLVWVDEEKKVKYTLGISQLFNFYIF